MSFMEFIQLCNLETATNVSAKNTRAQQFAEKLQENPSPVALSEWFLHEQNVAVSVAECANLLYAYKQSYSSTDQKIEPKY